MSVVVIGMDYPNNCEECKIKSWDIEGYVCPFSGVDTLSIGRQTNCPLRPMPEKYGRLVDVDAIISEPGIGTQIAGWGKMYHETVLQYAPTIVEAEE